MQFEIIGADTENYYLMAFDDERDLINEVFLCKISIDYFSDYVFKRETVMDFLIDVELYIEDMYEYLIEDGFLNVINREEFSFIDITFGGGIDEIMRRD